jgi:hypothetical protein
MHNTHTHTHTHTPERGKVFSDRPNMESTVIVIRCGVPSPSSHATIFVTIDLSTREAPTQAPTAPSQMPPLISFVTIQPRKHKPHVHTVHTHQQAPRTTTHARTNPHIRVYIRILQHAHTHSHTLTHSHTHTHTPTHTDTHTHTLAAAAALACGQRAVEREPRARVRQQRRPRRVRRPQRRDHRLNRPRAPRCAERGDDAQHAAGEQQQPRRGRLVQRRRSHRRLAAAATAGARVIAAATAAGAITSSTATPTDATNAARRSRHAIPAISPNRRRRSPRTNYVVQAPRCAATAPPATRGQPSNQHTHDGQQITCPVHTRPGGSRGELPSIANPSCRSQ